MTGNRLWTIGTAVLIVAIVVMGWFLVISPVVAQGRAAESQVAQIQSQNAAKQSSMKVLETQFATLPEQTAKLAALQMNVPDSADLGDFLDQIQGLAAASGVTVTNFAASEATAYGSGAGAVVAPPAAPAPTSSASAAPGATATKGAAEGPAAVTGGDLSGKLFTVPISLAVTGSSQQIMAFAEAAQTGKRFFLVTGVSFNGDGVTTTGTVTGSIFVVREPLSPSAPAATKP